MTLSIDLNEHLRARLEDAARREGIAPTEYARRVLEQGLLGGAAADGNRATLDLLTAWDRERAELSNDDGGDGELAELKRALNENRSSGRKPFP